MLNFAAWLEHELKNRDWRPIDLARKSKQYPATINRVLNGERNAGPDTCLAIARALDIPPELIFRLAGLLPPCQDPGENEETLLHHYRLLDEAGQREARALVNLLRETHASWADE